MPPLTRRDLLLALAGAPFLPQPRAPDMSSHDARLLGLDVVEISARVTSREISILELVDAYLERIDALNPSIAAFVTVTADRARADARRMDAALKRGSSIGPLAGVPFAHKDLFETAGIRTTAGSRLYDRHIPRRDADIVRSLATAGTLLLGKTNTHELGGGVTTINPFYGTTRNPWDRSRIPGGSSGGSAAAVAAGMAAAATGSDTGGSVRIPAAFCGCVGFKPSFGRLSTRGLLGASPTFDHAGLLTRTVADAELIYRALTAPVHPTRAPVHGTARDALDAPDAPGALRLGLPRSYFFDSMQPDVIRAVDEAIAHLRTIATEIRDVAFPIAAGTMAAVFDPIVVAEIQTRFAADWKARPGAFSPSFAAVLQAERPAASAVANARRALDAYRREVASLFQTVDVLVMPTVPIVAPPIEGPIDGGLILRNTWPFNAAGTPALSVPCGADGNGLPIGLQLVSAVGDDSRLLALGRALEAATARRRLPAV